MAEHRTSGLELPYSGLIHKYIIWLYISVQHDKKLEAGQIIVG